jgi:hypothetical protein
MAGKDVPVAGRDVPVAGRTAPVAVEDALLLAFCGKPTVPVTSKKCFYGWQRCPCHQFLQEGEILIENPEKMPTFYCRLY